jgi:monovalent cation:proton antiporter-2 (CPA2) family protein
MLQTLVILLTATAIAVPISRRLGFGSILGYLVGGVIIGPSVLKLVTDVEQISEVSELGVVMLLFLIGLEVRPHRLWVLRKAVFGLGLGQMVPTGLLLAVITHSAGVPWAGATVLGAGLALSSTAIVLPMLGERKLLSTSAGRDAFAVLLFQDMAFIPLVALVPYLAGAGSANVHWTEVARGVGVIVAILLGGQFLVPPIFRLVGGARVPEVFTATTLLIVVGTAALASWAGLSASLGAFMAGVLLSDSEFRHELQANIEPFEGLLLGFFFISVGMAANLHLASQEPVLVGAAVLVLVATKLLVGFVLGYIKRRNLASALRFGLALPEGSEFVFVLFSAAIAAGALTREQSDLATLVIAISMMLVPILFILSEMTLVPLLSKAKKHEPAYDLIDGPPTPVLICGFGRMGQIIGRLLTMRHIRFTALDKSTETVAVVRRFGGKVYFGNPARVEVLRAAGAEQARLLVVLIDDTDEALQVIDIARRYFPHLVIYARARNRQHVYQLMDRGVINIVRETFFSSLRMAETILTGLDIPAEAARRAVHLFREHDERTLVETHAIHHDEKQLIQSAHQAAEELATVFEADLEADEGRSVEGEAGDGASCRLN